MTLSHGPLARLAGTAGSTAATRSVRAGAIAALFLTLLASAEAQVRGLTPGPQVWRWYQGHSEHVVTYVSVRRQDPPTSRDALDRLGLARDATSEAEAAFREFQARTGSDLRGVALLVTDQLPPDYRDYRYLPSTGGITVHLAPDLGEVAGSRLPARAWRRRRIREQVAGAFLWHHLNRVRPRSPFRRLLLRRLRPAWMLVGLAAWMAGEAEPHEEALLRASLESAPPRSLSDLVMFESLDAYRKQVAFVQARSFAGWLAERHGLAPCLRFLELIRRHPTRTSRAFRGAFGSPLDSQRKEWASSVRSKAREFSQATGDPAPLRLLARLPGWSGGHDPSPDATHLALVVNERVPRNRIPDLMLLPRFGPADLIHVGGPPVVAPPVWIDGERLLALHQEISPFGQPRQQVRIHPIRQAMPRNAVGPLEAIGQAMSFGRSVLLRTVGGTGNVLISDHDLTGLGVSPDRLWLSITRGHGPESELLLFRLGDLLARPGGSEGSEAASPVRRVPLPAGSVHRWTENHGSILISAVDSQGQGEIWRLDPETAGFERLVSRPRPIRSLFGTRERIFFTEHGADLIESLNEFNPRTGSTRTLFRDPRAILGPRLVEDGHRVVYTRFEPGGLSMVEREMPEPPTATLPGSKGPNRGPEPAPDATDLAGDRSLAEEARAAPADPEVPSYPGLERYRPRFNRRRDRLVVDDDALGLTMEWRDAFNQRSISAALWRGDAPHQGNWEVLYYDNRNRPSWFAGAFDTDDEDLLGIFPLSDVSSGVSQRGGLTGIAWQTTPTQSWSLSAEAKTLEYDPGVFAGRLPAFDPDVHILRLRWILNELSLSPDQGLSPYGDRLLSLSLARSAFGGDARYWEVLGDFRTYVPLTNGADSFATRFAFGFRNPEVDPAPIPLDFTLGGSEDLRGIRDDALTGEKFMIATLEYRRLLSRSSGVRRGLDRLGLGFLSRPFRFDQVYASVFFDMGTAWDDGFGWGRMERGVGIELRSQGFLTAFRPASIRLGFAHGFGPLGVNDIYLATSTFF